MVRLRSGKQTICEDYDLDYCRHFLAGEYPDFSLFTLLQLRQLKRSLETNFDTIHYEVANDRQHIELFLLAQWKQYHEDLLLMSTPLNNNTYVTTFEVVIEHCNIKRCDIDFDFDFEDEFLCNICTQDTCVGYGFKAFSVHSPSYGCHNLRYRSNIAAYNKKIIHSLWKNIL